MASTNIYIFFKVSIGNLVVTGPLVGVMGSLQALEALKLLLGMPSPVAGTLRRFDALTHQWQTLTLAPDPDCPVCGSTHPA